MHPHRNLILKALDGIHEAEPDLFEVEMVAGDRLLLCSDGVSGVLDDRRLADILSTGTPDYAAVELVRASLEAGSSDNVTCVVADVLDASTPVDDDDPEPMLVGAAAELRRRAPRNRQGSIFRGHRSGDTGELDPVPAEMPDDVPFAIPSDPIDPEEARYAPRPPRRFVWLRRLLVAAIVVGVVWVAAAAAWSWSQQQYYVGEQDGQVVIFRGINADLPGVSLSSPYETTNVELDRLSDFDAGKVREGIDAGRPRGRPQRRSTTWPPGRSPTAATHPPRRAPAPPRWEAEPWPRPAPSWGSCTGVAGVRSSSCSSSRSRSASARTPPSASASRARSRPTSSGTAAGWPR